MNNNENNNQESIQQMDADDVVEVHELINENSEPEQEINSVSSNELFKNKLIELKEWMNNNNMKKPIQNSKNRQENHLAKYLFTCKQNRKNRSRNWRSREQMWNDIFGDLSLLEIENVFMNRLLELKQWIEMNNRNPIRNSNDTCENRLGTFMTNCRMNRRRQLPVWTRDERESKWLEVFGDLSLLEMENVFMNRLLELKQWIEHNEGKIPRKSSMDVCEKSLGIYMASCRLNRRRQLHGWQQPEREQNWIQVFGDLSLLE
jgi:hypothetical protein